MLRRDVRQSGPHAVRRHGQAEKDDPKTETAMAREVTNRSDVSPAASLLAVAIGAAAVGAMAIGVVAIGRLAVGRLAVGRVRVKKAQIARLEIDELTVRKLRILEPETRTP
jgi:hypothetical protein